MSCVDRVAEVGFGGDMLSDWGDYMYVSDRYKAGDLRYLGARWLSYPKNNYLE